MASALDIPALRGRVNDYAGVMQSNQAQSLEAQLAQLERDTGHQVAVLTIPTLDGEDIEGFSIRVAENWKIGKKGFDNGVILIVAVKDRKLRLEVGYGLEGLLPDAMAKRINADYIVPHFRQQDYAGGIVAGIGAVDKLLRKEPLPESARKQTRQRGFQINSTAMLAITFAILGLMAAASSGNRRGNNNNLWGTRGRRGPTIWGGPGGFGGGGFSGGGSSDGGGFSGGGGSFGGGGSSDSW
ncbi:MAG: hypothetical protein EXR70_14135 [Deltaproteobacteria bacterium]|nr:hypothetical protein [Deltaproteobacteria bacterium]